MPIYAPAFREINFYRISKAAKDGCSNYTLACIINDTVEPDDPVTQSDVAGFLKLQALGSKRMLMKMSTCDAIAPESTPG